MLTFTQSFVFNMASWASAVLEIYSIHKVYEKTDDHNPFSSSEHFP